MLNNIDTIEKFIFENKSLRGNVLRLHNTLINSFTNNNYPNNIKKSLGELMVGLIHLIVNAKFEGNITISLNSESKVNLLLVCGDNENNLRSYLGTTATYEELEKIELKEILKDATLVVTLLYNNGKKYQSYISLEGVLSISEAFNKFFNESSQISTFTHISYEDNNISAMMLQEIPSENSKIDFEDILPILNTITDEEMLKLNFHDLLYRLFNEYKILTFPAENIQFKCNCSKDKYLSYLNNLSVNNLQDLLQDDEKLTINCEFCGKLYNIYVKELDNKK